MKLKITLFIDIPSGDNPIDRSEDINCLHDMIKDAIEEVGYSHDKSKFELTGKK